MTRQKKTDVPRAIQGRAQHFFNECAQVLHTAPPNQSSQHTWTSLEPIKTHGESTCESSENSLKNLIVKATYQTQ